MEPFATYADYARAVAPGEHRAPHVAYLEAHPNARFTAFLRCPACRVIRIDPMPQAASLAGFYEAYAGNARYADKTASKLRRAHKRLRPLRRRVRGRDFLDVGASIGTAAEAARRLGFRATGIEISAEAVARAQSQFPGNHFVHTTAEPFAATGAQFDLVHCTEVIEHVADPVAFVAALYALVKPGGLVYLTTPDAGHWCRPRDFLQWSDVKPPEHVTWQCRRSLRHLFVQAGFSRPRFQISLKPGIRLLARRP